MQNLHILHSNYCFCSGDKIIIYSVKIIIDFFAKRETATCLGHSSIILLFLNLRSHNLLTAALAPSDFHLLGQPMSWEEDWVGKVHYKFWLELQGKPSNGEVEEL